MARHRDRNRLLGWFLGLCGSAAAASVFAADPSGPAGAGVAAAPATLVVLMERRLDLMPQVAAYKWHHRQPVQDPAREAVVVAEARAEALRYGLVPETVERLFVVQMEAARAVQSWWLDAWAAGRGAPPPAPDLAREVRPALSALGSQIVAAAAEAVRPPYPAALSVGQALPAEPPFSVAGLDQDLRQALLAAIAGLTVYPDRLAQILATGRLRIGTTGDYAPFSHRDEGAAAFVGIDIDLGRDLAASMGVEPEFVLTSWPGLVDDLRSGRFDIAMSGVSRTLARQRVGLQTAPFHADGKTAIARCAELSRFDTFEEIDRAGVRVVVNPGGTNERFVDERVRHAQKVLHPDNRTIFGELLAGRADVMFTDRIEVLLQSRRHPQLCGTLADDLTYQEKAYLVPQDPVWLEFVDTWLALRLAEGGVDAVFAAHGVERRPPR